MPNWQPMIDAAAALLGSYTVMVMLVITWFCALFGRDRIATWFEAIGADGVLEMMSSWGNSPRALFKLQRQAQADASPKTGEQSNVQTLVRP